MIFQCAVNAMYLMDINSMSGERGYPLRSIDFSSHSFYEVEICKKIFFA